MRGNEAEIMKGLLRNLSPADIVTQAMLMVLSLILIIYNSNIIYWYIFLPVNFLLIFAVYKIVNGYEAGLTSAGGVDETGFSYFEQYVTG